MKNMDLIVLLTLTALFTLIVFPGYGIFGGDHSIYIPQIYKTINPELYPNDTLFEFSQTSLTKFSELIIFSMNFTHMNIFYVMILLAFITRILFIYSIYKIALYIADDEKFSFFSS